MAYRTLSFTKKGHIAAIKIARPSAGKTVNPEFVRELEEVRDHINNDDEIYVVILTGTGASFVTFSDGKGGERPPPGSAAAIAAIERPVIAAINGDTFGIGLEIVLSCDIRIASYKARFALPQVAQGHLPADGGTQRLPRIIGRGKALEMLLTADTLSTAEALEIGLVNKVVPPGELMKEARQLAEIIAAKSPLALRYLKEAVIKGMDLTLEQGLRLEADLYFLLHTTDDRTEGITAFREKRRPEFKGK
jgi:enoyl-CoA hydratase/carnithine racemase